MQRCVRFGRQPDVLLTEPVHGVLFVDEGLRLLPVPPLFFAAC